jgi:glycosyltransferase involved in cell wall biosynthesis
MKRLEMLLDTATALPNVTFDIVGAPEQDTTYSRALLATAGRLPNVILHGRVARDDMPRFYQAASVLCCTSTYEGFPNTFLEAWSHGVPVVSTVDPDGLIASRGLGATATDAAGLAHSLRTFSEDPAAWRAASARCRGHYLDRHTVDAAMTGFATAFRAVLGPARSDRVPAASR